MPKNIKGKLTLAYTAGIIDGEGCISIIKNSRASDKLGYHFYLVVSVVNTNQWLINWLQMQYGGRIAFRNKVDRNHKNSWSWQMEAGRARDFLKLVLPYLNLKHPQAEVAINFQATRILAGRHQTEEVRVIQEAQRILMQKLNKKGKD